MDPETFADSRLILLWGTNTLTTNHHLWKYIEAARGRGGPRRRHRPDAHADRGRPPTSTWRRSPAPTPRWRWASCTSSSRRAARTATSSPPTRWGGRRSAERILEFPPERVSAITGLPARAHRRPRRAAGHDAPDRHPSHYGPAAPRRRRHGGARHHLHPGRHRRLALSRGRRRRTTRGASSAATGRRCGATTCARPGRDG